MSYTAEMYRRVLSPSPEGLTYTNQGVTFRVEASSLRYVYRVTCQVCADEPVTADVSGLSWLEQWTTDHVRRSHA